MVKITKQCGTSTNDKDLSELLRRSGSESNKGKVKIWGMVKADVPVIEENVGGEERIRAC